MKVKTDLKAGYAQPSNEINWCLDDCRDAQRDCFATTPYDPRGDYLKKCHGVMNKCSNKCSSRY